MGALTTIGVLAPIALSIPPLVATLNGLPWRTNVAIMLGEATVIPALAFVKDWSWMRRMCAILALLLLVAVISLIWFSSDRLALKREPATTGLSFAPVNSPVPWCNDFEGTGSIPRGHKLLVFDRAIYNYNGQQVGSFYYDDGPVKPEGTGWSISDVLLGARGDAGYSGELVALLVSDKVANFLHSIYIRSPSRAYWESAALPPGIEVSHAPFRRSKYAGNCH